MDPRDDVRSTDGTERTLSIVRAELAEIRRRLANRLSDHGARHAADGPDPVAVAAVASAWDPGDIKVSAADVVPAGWLDCDGSEQSRIGQAALFAAIGTRYGAGNGTTTFNLPPAGGRALVGQGTGSGLTARTLGAVFGEENHTLTQAETPIRGHLHAVSVRFGPGTTHAHQNNAGTLSEGNEGAGVGTNANTTAADEANANGHNVIQPSLALRLLIKT